MKSLTDETPRDVLTELEQRARAAERLAEALSFRDVAVLPEPMIAELERHADTADLAAALRSGELARMAAEAQALNRNLSRPNLTLEEQRRLEHALRRTLDAARPEQPRHSTAQRLAEAHQGLAQGNPARAAEAFAQLAERFGQSAQRQTAQKQLQDLARQLRSAGQQMFGRRNQGVARLNQSQARQGMRQLSDGRQGTALGTFPLAGRPLGGNGGQIPRSSAPMLSGNRPGQQTPVPGSCPGTRGGNGGAPVPGGQGQRPGSGMGARSGAGGEPGGLQAGHGSAAYTNLNTQPLDATSEVTAQPDPTGEGPSETRLVEAPQMQENPRRALQMSPADFIRAEEDALSGEPLPVSRREHIIRYFSALRERIENDQ